MTMPEADLEILRFFFFKASGAFIIIVVLDG